MKHLQIYNANIPEIKTNNYDIFIGISVGIKPMSESIALEYIDWANQHTSKKIKILIADEIAQLNYLAFSHSTKLGAQNHAKRDGDRYQKFFEKLKAMCQLDFDIVRWHDIICDKYHATLKHVLNEFEVNDKFRNEITSIAEKYISMRRSELNKEKYHFVYQYLLLELPTLLNGIYIHENNYNLILYPTYKHSGMSQLVSDIHNRKRFNSLGEKVCSNKVALVEWRIDLKEQCEWEHALLE